MPGPFAPLVQDLPVSENMTLGGGQGRRVVHVLRKYNPREWGGTETHVVEVTRRLVRLGWWPQVHAPLGPTEPDRALDPHVPLLRYRAFAPYLGTPEKRQALIANAGNLVTLDEPLRLIRDRRLALAHLHTAGRIGGAVRTAMRLTGRPYVLSVHGPLLSQREWFKAETAQQLEGVMDLGRPFGALLGSRKVLRDAARVLTFNDEEQRALSEVVGARAVRLDQGVDADRLRTGCVSRGYRRWPGLAGVPLLVLLGRLSPQKNQQLAIRAFAQGAPGDHHLAIAGAAMAPSYRGCLEQEIHSLGLSGRVHLLGNLDAVDEVPDLLALAKLVIVPSAHEAFGLIVLEAWAAGRPTLTSLRGGLKDLADALGRDALCVPSLEVAAWATALRQVLANPEALAAAAQAGQRLIQRRFGWDAVALRIEEIYQAVLDERGLL